MFKRILCFICYLIGHDGVFSNKYFPSFDAPIITRWEHKSSCLRCGDVTEAIYIWDGKDFIKT